jgi:DNA-binding ferritin-like protein
MSGDSDELLAEVRGDLEELKACFEELIAVADSEGHTEISNYAQEQVLDIAKSIWMLSATLD